MSGSAFNCTNKVFRMSKSVQFFFLQKWFFVPNLARKVWLASVRPLEYAIMSEIQSYSSYHRPIFVILLSYPTYLKWLSLSCLSLNNKIFRMSEKIERVADNMNTTVSLTSISVRNNLLPRFFIFHPLVFSFQMENVFWWREFLLGTWDLSKRRSFSW